jgi:hypothetical protein
MAALLLGCGVFGWTAAGEARADPIGVQVGYADGLRGVGFFPSPWAGDAGVVFVGNSGPGLDTGAIRIDNTSGAAITVNDVSVQLHPASSPGLIFDLWGSNMVPTGGTLIVDQTAFYNFDTSDFPISPVGVPVHGGPDSPVITVTVNGTPYVYTDTAHVLDTEGFDYASIGNESFAWRPVGGASGPAGTPEPASMTLMGFGAAGLAGYLWRRRKARVMAA